MWPWSVVLHEGEKWPQVKMFHICAQKTSAGSVNRNQKFKDMWLIGFTTSFVQQRIEDSVFCLHASCWYKGEGKLEWHVAFWRMFRLLPQNYKFKKVKAIPCFKKSSRNSMLCQGIPPFAKTQKELLKVVAVFRLLGDQNFQVTRVSPSSSISHLSHTKSTSTANDASSREKPCPNILW